MDFKELLFGPYLVFFIFFVIGFIELTVFFLWRYSSRKKLTTWYPTEGTVTEVLSGRGSKGGTVYYPVFQYKTHLNQTITKRSGMGSNPAFYSAGSKVDIFYNPDNPERFIIKGDKRLRLMFIILGLVFGIFFLIGLAGILWLAYSTGSLG